MKRVLSFLFALALPAFSQATGDYQVPKWNGTKFVPQNITPAANSLLSWDGSGAPVALAKGPFASGTDAANLTGTLAAARIADSSLSIAKVASLQTTLDAKAGTDLSNVSAADLSAAVAAGNIGNYAKPDCLWNTAVRMAADRQAFKAPVVSILTIGDSWNLSPRDYFVQQLGECSTLMPASSVVVSGGAVSPGTTPGYNTSYDKTPNGTYLVLSGSGHTGTFGRSEVGATGRLQPSMHLVVHYEAVSGGGSFKVQCEDAAGTWVDVGTVNTDNSGASTYTTWESPALTGVAGLMAVQSPRVRVVWVSGSCKVYAAGSTAVSGNAPTAGNNRQGLIYYNPAVGSSYVSQWDLCPQAVWTTLLTALKTDIVFIREARDSQFDSLAQFQTKMQSIVSKLRTARPTVDIVFIGSHPVQDPAVDAEFLATDAWLRTYCTANNFLFVDMRKFFPTFAQGVSMGLLNAAPDIHMTDNGKLYAKGVIAAHCRPITDFIGMHFDSTPQNGPSWWKDGAVGTFKLWHDNLVSDIDFGNVPQSTGSFSANNGVIFRWHKTDTSWQSTGWSMLRATQPFIQVNDQSRIYMSPPTSTWLSRQIAGTVELHSGASSRIGLAVSGVAGQTSSLQEWQTGASPSVGGTVATRIDAAGNLKFDVAGLGVTVKAGSNARIGSALTLSAGVGTVGNTSVTANTHVDITKVAHGGTGGTSYVVKRFAQATATATVNAGAVTGFTITASGEGYSAPPSVTIGGPGSGATGTAVLTNGKVTSITLGGGGGTGYSTAPTVTLGAPPTPVGFTITATDASGATVTTDTSTFDWYLIERQ